MTSVTPRSVPAAAPEGRPTTVDREVGDGVRTGSGLRWAGWVASLVLLALLVVASIAIGSKDIAFGQVLDALTHPTGSDQDLVVTALRVPRTVLGLLVGASLGVAGALIQAFTRNPLADPGILGVNGGATVLVTVGVAFFGMTSITQYLWLALAGAVGTTVLVYAIGRAGRGATSPVRLTLAGVGVAAVLGGITTAITLTNPTAFASMLSWSAGSLTGPPLATSALIAPFVIVGLLIAGAITRDLNALALGDDLGASLGSRAARTRVLAVVGVTLLAGAATAAAGPIGFVGLMIPHVARWITGPDQRWIFAYTLTLGPCLLLASDVIGRVVMRPAELPVGIVTAFVGAPVLILLARRAKASGL
ncbi:FecCD family ABC transporter permease [Humibacter ginsenosidimutans]|uniref:FecCD family ABC transporter permease n=1 Tax=Humibacter ginsenosidimutans TaxID=2599293 RepID=UPI001FEDDFC1|nr:iron chelate uptake ABC transporter family permease subunit [Humibacter ginsenosidimutans]